VKPTGRPEKHALEFHDSEILSVRKIGAGIEVTLDGYLHCEEDGRKTGWTQPVIFVFANGKDTSVSMEFPVSILTGNLFVSGQEIEELVQLPFEGTGTCRFFGLTCLSQNFDFTGDAIAIHAVGEAKYVEEVSF
jgi:hypothetical protein